MKNKTLQTTFITVLFVITIGSIYAYNDESIEVKFNDQFYIVEGIVNTQTFYIWNYDNSTFNGTAITWIEGEKIRWKEELTNLSIMPNSSVEIQRKIDPDYPGLYWANIKVNDLENKEVLKTQNSFNVHSSGEAFTILGVIIALLSFIAYLKFKK